MTHAPVQIPWPGWKVTRHLGGGSFGKVYEIQRELLGGGIEKAAMKVISVPGQGSEAQDLLSLGYDRQSINRRYLADLEDIAREYGLMAALKGNSNVVYCDDVRHQPKADGLGWELFIKMELLTPLKKVLTNPPREAQVVQVGVDICNALAACRRSNIIHRDIKPDNIMVSSDGHYKLGDFGVAKTTERTAGGTKTGSYGFMAPEVYNNQPYGTAVDIYSLGMVLYWMLNGLCGPFLPQPPLVPTGAQMEAARMRRFDGEALPEPVYGSAALKKVVLKACAFRPEDRFGTPQAFAHMLEASLETEEYDFGGTARTVTGETFREQAASAASGTGTASWGTVGGNSWEDSMGGTQGTQGTRGDSDARELDSFHIRMKLELTAQEAAQGCTKTVSIPGHGKVAVHVPEGVVREGYSLRLRGKGKVDSATGARGDAYLQIHIRSVPGGDFWKKDPGPGYDAAYCISSKMAQQGSTLELRFGDSGKTRKITIPPACRNGHIVDGVKIVIHDCKLYPDKAFLEKQEDAVLAAYRDRKGYFIRNMICLCVVSTLICMVLASALPVAPFYGAALMVGTFCLVIRSLLISATASTARGILQQRGL